MLNVLRDNCMNPPFAGKNRVSTQLLHFRTDKNDRKLRSPYGCLCNWEILIALMYVRLMYLQSGVHWKHFSPRSHSFLACFAQHKSCFLERKQKTTSAHPEHETVLTDGCLCRISRSLAKMWVDDASHVRARSISFNKRNYSFIVRFIQIPVHLEFSWVFINGVALPLLRWSSEEKNCASSPNIPRQHTMFRF